VGAALTFGLLSRALGVEAGLLLAGARFGPALRLSLPRFPTARRELVGARLGGLALLLLEGLLRGELGQPGGLRDGEGAVRLVGHLRPAVPTGARLVGVAVVAVAPAPPGPEPAERAGLSARLEARASGFALRLPSHPILLDSGTTHIPSSHIFP